MTDLDLLNKRNIDTLAAAQKQDRAYDDETRRFVQLLQQTVTMQTQQIQRLEQEVAAIRAMLYGRGGTAR